MESRIVRYEISLSLPLNGETDEDRQMELHAKLDHIETSITRVGGTCEFASHASNEEVMARE